VLGWESVPNLSPTSSLLVAHRRERGVAILDVMVMVTDAASYTRVGYRSD